MYEQFGAVVVGDRVTFKLFLPDNQIDPSQYMRGGSPRIKEIRVRGSFQSEPGGSDWALASAPKMTKTPHAGGWLYSCELPEPLTEGFYQYKYFVTFENDTTRWCGDPCAKYGGANQHENAAFVVGGPTAVVQPLAERLPPRDLIAYEMMVDDFTKEFRGPRAPFDAVGDKLAYLKSLGINAVEMMPWTAWPGSGFSWGYDPHALFAVEHHYMDDAAEPAAKLVKLKQLINTLHEEGIAVIMDAVFNHVQGDSPNRGFAYKWLYQETEDSPYVGGYGGAGYFDELDYNNECVQQYILDVCKYWLDVYQIDGIRFDYTLGFYRAGDPDSGIAQLITDVKAHLAAGHQRNVALMLEHLTDNRYHAIDDTNQVCATGCWFDPALWALAECARSGSVNPDLLRIVNSAHDFAVGKSPVVYAENHDHSTLTCMVGGRHRWYKGQPAAIVLFTIPGIVLVHNGQEFAEDYWMPEHGDGRVEPRPLRWARSTDSAGSRLRGVFARLASIRSQHPALRSPNVYPFQTENGYGIFPDRSLLVYHRWGQAQDGQLERFIIAVNFSDWHQVVDLPLSMPGRWQDLLSGVVYDSDDWWLRGHTVNSNWGVILYKRG